MRVTTILKNSLYSFGIYGREDLFKIEYPEVPSLKVKTELTLPPLYIKESSLTSLVNRFALLTGGFS